MSIMRGLSPAVVLKVSSLTQQAEDVLVSKYINRGLGREEDTVSIMRGLSPAVVLKVCSSTQQAEDVLVSKYNSQELQITRVAILFMINRLFKCGYFTQNDQIAILTRMLRFCQILLRVSFYNITK